MCFDIKKIINPFKWFKSNKIDPERIDNCDHKCILELGQVMEDVIDLPDDFVMGNKTCLIIDDNYGQVNVLADDLEAIFNKYEIKDVNILKIHTNMGAFEVNDLLNKFGGDLRIEYVIADLTIGGSMRIGNENVKLTGVDVIGFLKNYCNKIKILIYTGNNLNKYIDSNVKMINKFKVITGKDIDNYVIIKRSLSILERRAEIAKRLFNIG